MVSAGLLAVALLGATDLASIALGAGERARDTPTEVGFIDFLIEVAPGINLILFALLGHRMRQVKNTAEAVEQGVRQIRRSGVRVLTDSRGVARAVQLDDDGHGFDADGREWALVEKKPERGRRHYDPRRRDR